MRGRTRCVAWSEVSNTLGERQANLRENIGFLEKNIGSKSGEKANP
jgi:hypothetical protein